MKKFITFITIVISIPAIGQNHYIGLNAGINSTNINSKNFTSENSSRNAYSCGLTYLYKATSRLNLGIDLLYFQKGFENDLIFTDEFGVPTGEKKTINFNYNYMLLPLKGGIAIGDRFSGFTNFGIVPSLLIDARTKTPTIGEIANSSQNVTDKVNKFDLGGLVEVGCNYKTTKGILMSTSIGFHHSFTTITNDEYFSNAEIRHYGIVVSIGASYALKGE